MSRSISSRSASIVLEAVGVNVAPHAADLARAEDDAAAGGGFDDVQHLLAHAPGVHEQALEAHGVRHQPQPEQVAVEAGELAPDGPQVQRARRHGDVHDRFDRLAIGLAVDEAADAADALGDIDELDVVLLLDQLLQAAMDEADGRARLDDLFVFDHQVEVDRLRQHRVLRAEGDDGAGHSREV